MQLIALVEFSVHNILRKKYIFNFERFTEIKLPILTELIYLEKFENFKYIKCNFFTINEKFIFYQNVFLLVKRKTNFILVQSFITNCFI